MDKTPAALVVLAVLLLLLALMWLGWRNLKRRNAGIPAPQPIPPTSAAEVLRTPGLHVATTHVGRPLDRVAVRGLAFRATADIRVTRDGVELRLAGGTDCYIPAAGIVGVDRGTWTLDRAVERGGLVVITWTLGDASIDTHLRVEDPAALVAAVSTLNDIAEGRKPA